MASLISRLRSRLMRSAYGAAQSLSRLDPSGRTELRLQRLAARRVGKRPTKLAALASAAERRDDSALALDAWRVVARTGAFGQGISQAKTLLRIATHETRLRRLVSASGTDWASPLRDAPQLSPALLRTADLPTLPAREQRKAVLALEAFWRDVPKLSEKRRAALRAAYAALAAHRIKARRPHVALAALLAPLAIWPDYQFAYRLYYKAVLEGLRPAGSAAGATAGDGPETAPDAGRYVADDGADDRRDEGADDGGDDGADAGAEAPDDEDMALAEAESEAGDEPAEAADEDGPTASPADEETWLALSQFWAFADRRRARISRKTRQQLEKLTEYYAGLLTASGDAEGAARLRRIAEVDLEDRQGDPRAESLASLARAAEQRRDWRAAVGHWQQYAAVMNPVSSKSGSIVAENAQERGRLTRLALIALRRARAELALVCQAEGRRREFRELAARVVESMPDHRILKFDPLLLSVASAYVRDALAEDGYGPRAPAIASDAPLRRLAICLDVMKLSDLHTHARVVLTMSRNLLAFDPELQIDLVITNERFAVTTPVVASSFDPALDDGVAERARAALGEHFGRRFRLHICRAPGLEGVVRACETILGLAPDLVFYGGGHRGFYSNESRLVRHSLHDLVPSAFFFIQSNNEVDPKLDMILARGPHRIDGDPGPAEVRIAPYPTIVDDDLARAQAPVDPAKAGRGTIVSAISGVRMDLRLREMAGPELDRFLAILDRVPGTVWHFIGCRDPEAVLAAVPSLAARHGAGQVQLHGVMPFDDFTRMVGQASLFLHLPGFTGGSGGAAVARRAAVPILTFAHSDVSGRQPPETVFAEDDVDGFVAMAIRLLQDADLWAQTAERQIAQTEAIRRTAAAGFVAALNDAARRGRARLAGNGSATAPVPVLSAAAASPVTATAAPATGTEPSTDPSPDPGRRAARAETEPQHAVGDLVARP